MGILTGGIIQPLNVSWRIFFKIGEDILGTHLIYSTNVDGLQSHFGDCYKKKEQEQEKDRLFLPAVYSLLALLYNGLGNGSRRGRS